jgi:hypothetical protein
MSLRLYLVGLMFSTIFCWACFVLILFYVNPDEAGFVGFLAFYLSLFFALTGTFSLIGFYLRVWLSRNEILFKHISPAFRQGFFLALILVISLVLQAFRILTWWDGLLLVGSVVLLEFYFMSRQTT